MESSDLTPEAVVATERERLELTKAEKLLQSLRNGDRVASPRLVGSNGEEIPLPEPVLRLLGRMVRQLARGNGVMVSAFHQPLTIEEAAFLLNLKWQQVEQLLDSGEILFVEGHWERKILFDDVMAYKQKWQEFRRQKLDEMTRMSQESGLYSMALDANAAE